MKLRLGHKMSLVGLIPLIAFIIVGIQQFTIQFGEFRLMNSMLLNIKLAQRSSVLINDLQRERGRTSLFLAGGSSFDDVQKIRSEADKSSTAFQYALDHSVISNDAKARCITIKKDIDAVRDRYSKQDATLRKQEIKDYTELIRLLMHVQSDVAQSKTTRGFGKVLTSLCLLEEARESAGLLRANVSSLLSIDKALSGDDFSNVLKLKAGVDVNMFSPALAISKKSTELLENMKKSDRWEQVENVLHTFIMKAATGDFGISGDTFFKQMTEKNDDIGTIIEKEIVNMEQRAREEKAALVASFAGITSFFIAVVLLVGALIWYFTRDARFRLDLVNKLLTEIAQGEGDLTRRIEVKGGDEITEIASSFNTFVDKINAIVNNVKSSAMMVSSSVGSLNQSSSQVSESARSTANLSDSVAAAAEKTTVIMNNTSQYMKRTNDSLSSVAAATEEMSATISDVAENAQRAMTTSKEAAFQTREVTEHIRVLGDAAKEIGTVTDAIANISAQTNLLALNATIEAARAGAAGKGFVVVANEIKTLAEQTAEATGDIRQKIAAIQNLTNTTVDEVQKIDEIVKNVDEIISMITTAIEEQATVTKDVAANIVRATDGARDAGIGVDETASAARNTADNIREITSAAANLNSAGSNVSVASNELKSVAENLNHLVNKFKTN